MLNMYVYIYGIYVYVSNLSKTYLNHTHVYIYIYTWFRPFSWAFGSICKSKGTTACGHVRQRPKTGRGHISTGHVTSHGMQLFQRCRRIGTLNDFAHEYHFKIFKAGIP